MCGITGFAGNIPQRESKILLTKMLSEISHRGPDAQGLSISSEYAFGHQRLSILDLSKNGSQPMTSTSSRYVIIYNGEIYNYQAIKTELISKGIKFSGNSDTEVLLTSIEQYGLKDTLKKLKGMFAFALWDKENSSLQLVRDRMGEKPLYYTYVNGSLVFSSELKSILKFPGFVKEIDRDSLALYFKYNNVPAPFCIFKNVKKLKPAHMIKFSKKNGLSEQIMYWDIEAEAQKCTQSPLSGAQNIANTLEKELKVVIEQQMISDVPYGAFLSGGIDSSLIVSIMQSISKKPINTFSIGFNERGFDEAVYAKKVANHLGTNHTELYVTTKNSLDVIPKLPRIYCEPFSDSSQIPTFLVSELAKTKVTVSLSGDGGDELFGGYNRHFWIDRMWNLKHRIPELVQTLADRTISSLSAKRWNQLGDHLLLGKVRSLGDKLYKAKPILNLKDKNEIYNNLVSHFNTTNSIVKNSSLNSDPFHINQLKVSDFTQKMLLHDQMTYLPNDILVKVDRAAMANSLETRVPFLDQRIFNLSWKIPPHEKIQNGIGKLPLRNILKQYVPSSLIERPKVGFGIPLDQWLRHELRDWAENLLRKDRIIDAGLLNYTIIEKMWNEHISGKENWQYHLWDILMFQAWYEEYM